LIELDSRFTKANLKEMKKEKKDPHNFDPLRSIPDGDFELIPFGNDPSKNFKIDKDLLELVKAQLVVCLRENANLFDCRTIDMPEIDPSIVCHQLTVSHSASIVVRGCRKSCKRPPRGKFYF